MCGDAAGACTTGELQHHSAWYKVQAEPRKFVGVLRLPEHLGPGNQVAHPRISVPSGVLGGKVPRARIRVRHGRKVIGKGGAHASAIRTLLTAISGKEKKRYILEIIEY